MTSADGFTGKKVLVTGARGFIGSHLCRRLCSLAAEVHAVSRTASPGDSGNMRWWRLDLADLESLRRIFDAVRPELVYHLAGHVMGAREVELVVPTFHSNLTSSVNLFTVATQVGCGRIVLPGSLEAPEGDYTEAVASSPYAAAKWAASAYGRMFHALYDAPVVITRIFMVYGPAQQNFRKLIPYVTTSLLRGQSPKLSSGARSIDWIYVEDVVDGLLAAMQRDGLEGSRVDLGSGTLVTVRRLVERLVELIGTDVRPLFDELPERPLEQVRAADTAETRAKLGWRPTTSLEDGLQQTVHWYAERLRNGSLVI